MASVTKAASAPGTTLTRGSVTATGTVTTTSATYVDVTSASFSLTVAANSVTIISVSCELKTSVYLGGVNALIGSSGYIGDTDPTATTRANGYSGGNAVQLNTFQKLNFSAGVHSSQSGTGAQTVKAQFCSSDALGTSTASIKNVYLSAVNIPL